MKKRVSEVIVVEGKYDKNVVSQAVDATIIETSGFQIFSDPEKTALLRKLSEKRGLIVLTDSDSAGFLIRNHLRGMLGDADIKNAYIPEIPGKERRKRQRSKEGLLGVEGMDPRTIIDALIRAGATFEDEMGGTPEKVSEPITKADMYFAGLSGGADSAEKRDKLKEALALPSHLSPTGLLDVLNTLYTREEFLSLTAEIFGKD